MMEEMVQEKTTRGETIPKHQRTMPCMRNTIQREDLCQRKSFQSSSRHCERYYQTASASQVQKGMYIVLEMLEY